MGRGGGPDREVFIVTKHFWAESFRINDLATAMCTQGDAIAVIQVGERLNPVRQGHVDRAGDDTVCCDNLFPDNRATLVTQMAHYAAPQGSI